MLLFYVSKNHNITTNMTVLGAKLIGCWIPLNASLDTIYICLRPGKDTRDTMMFQQTSQIQYSTLQKKKNPHHHHPIKYFPHSYANLDNQCLLLSLKYVVLSINITYCNFAEGIIPMLVMEVIHAE
jgi:hypothetical protein